MNQLRQGLSVGQVGLVADGRHDHGLGPRQRGLEHREIARGDDPVLVPLE